MKDIIQGIFLQLLSIQIFAQKKIALSSPDGNIQYSFFLKDKMPFYNVSYKNKPIIENSALGLEFLGHGELKKNLVAKKPVLRDGVEEYQLVVAKTSKVRDPFKEAIITLEENISPFRKINLFVRIFNDGLAFRYEFPSQNNWRAFTLTDENTTF